MLQKVQDQTSVLLKRGVYTKSAIWNMGKQMYVDYECPMLYLQREINLITSAITVHSLKSMDTVETLLISLW
jgi:hypothetical protein